MISSNKTMALFFTLPAKTSALPAAAAALSYLICFLRSISWFFRYKIFSLNKYSKQMDNGLTT